MPRTTSCQLWTDALKSVIVGYSLHGEELPGEELPGTYGISVKWNGYVLWPEGDPYLVEVCEHEPRSDDGVFYTGLPPFTVMNPDGILAAVSHLSWEEIVERSQATWNDVRQIGTIRASRDAVPFWVSRRVDVKGYGDFIRHIREIHGRYVVKLEASSLPWPSGRGPMSNPAAAYFVRDTPEQLMDELRVAQVMES